MDQAPKLTTSEGHDQGSETTEMEKTLPGHIRVCAQDTGDSHTSKHRKRSGRGRDTHCSQGHLDAMARCPLPPTIRERPPRQHLTPAQTSGGDERRQARRDPGPRVPLGELRGHGRRAAAGHSGQHSRHVTQQDPDTRGRHAVLHSQQDPSSEDQRAGGGRGSPSGGRGAGTRGGGRHRERTWCHRTVSPQRAALGVSCSAVTRTARRFSALRPRTVSTPPCELQTQSGRHEGSPSLGVKNSV